jgi:hypothetical protein
MRDSLPSELIAYSCLYSRLVLGLERDLVMHKRPDGLHRDDALLIVLVQTSVLYSGFSSNPGLLPPQQRTPNSSHSTPTTAAVLSSQLQYSNRSCGTPSPTT